MVHAVEPKDDCPHLADAFRPQNLPEELQPRIPCKECESTRENWICLQCYQVHCSRFQAGHAGAHFEKLLIENDPNHCVAVSFSDMSVWCYQCDSYITHPSLRETLRKLYESKGEEEEEEHFINLRSPDHVYFPWNDVKWVMDVFPLVDVPIRSIDQLERTIEKISGMEEGQISVFKRYFDTKSKPLISESEFLGRLLPIIQRLVANSSDSFSTISNNNPVYENEWKSIFNTGPVAVVKDRIPFLLPGIQANVVMNRIQVACLLANLFFNTFDSISYLNPQSRIEFPEFTMNVIYTGFNQGVKAKLDCLLQYFLRFEQEAPVGSIVYSRIVVPKHKVPKWSSSTAPLVEIVVDDQGTIEGSPAIAHGDFANQFLGGGVLFGGNVQEEILFTIKPECIVGMLFSAKMEEQEAIVITGAEQFSNYSGYGGTFKYDGPHEADIALRLFDGTIASQILAFDAHVFSGARNTNFQLAKVQRELRKSFAAFQQINVDLGRNDIATGNWGCGMFGGDKHLKFLIQIISASQVGRDVLYYTFKDAKLKDDANEFLGKAKEKRYTVGALYNLLESNLVNFVNESESPNILAHLVEKRTQQ